MTRRYDWIIGEIKSWLDEGLIDPDQAETLEARYLRRGENSWGRMILSSLGAAVFGLGVVLFFAYNWDDMHKFAKLAVIFLALFLANGAGLAFSTSRMDRPHLKEGFHLLGTMMFGAGIWLIAQIYNIDSHYPNAFLLWALGAFALAWALPSIVQGLAAVVLITIWNWTEAFDFYSAVHLGPLLILLGLTPLAWIKKSKPLLFFSTVAFFLTYTANIGAMNDDLLFYSLFFCSVLCICLADLAGFSSFPESRRLLGFVGRSVYLVELYILCFEDSLRHIHFSAIENATEMLYFSLPLALSVAAMAWSLFSAVRKKNDPEGLAEKTLIIASFFLAFAASLASAEKYVLIRALAFNLIFLGHTLIFILQGCKKVDWKETSFGCLLFSALVIARFSDLFESLLVRSMVFLILGACIFIVGNFYSRSKKRLGHGKT